jgi:predicted unusual protein kinase regulating ubiquinone biosynthesis (AarF/ABC1/UbiB family)
MQNSTPITSLSRGKTVLKSAMKIGSKKALQLSKRTFLSTQEYKKEQESTDNEIASILFENISLLKGTAVKITQALALHNMLPKALQKELSKSYNQIEPINQVLVMKVLQNEFHKHYTEVFKAFDLKPFASASLGQVHLATTFKDKKVAVKIQYPSIDKTIQNDIKLIKRFTKLKKSLSPIIEEVETRLYEEIDYIKEMQNTLWAYDAFRSSEVLVPKVYKKYSTKHILTTSYVEGLGLHSWLALHPTKKEKQKVANTLFDIFVSSIFKHQKIQADPNPANYLITSEGKVVLIDFGCMKSFDEVFIENYIDIFRVYRSSDKKEVLTLYEKMGFIKRVKDVDDEIFQKKILPFNRWAIEPFLHERYKFTKEYLDEGVKYADMFVNKPFVVVEDFVFLDRTSHGLFSLFEQMGVEIDMRRFRDEVD